ncbi:MAG TPA: pyridoxamine 5'-phosphate oxidase family protein [Candidatus Acidoferrales bacterium]|nr:pyridoxamine 5'-phosphate oxidase family protein [Candidatus Acidoferrales bacterium]
MTRFAQYAFTAKVKALQERYRSRAAYAKVEANETGDGSLGPEEIEFVNGRDSFFMATVNSDGWPYVQHRGGPPGFLRAVDPKHLIFSDYAGNKQYVSLGNLETDDRVAMILMDYPTQSRLKIWGHARAITIESDPDLFNIVRPPKDYPARAERLFVIEVAAWDWNCHQHITPRYSLDELTEQFADRCPDAITDNDTLR